MRPSHRVPISPRLAPVPSSIARAHRLAEPFKLTVLVTGAGGLIGGELCGRLHDRGHRVIGLVHRRPTMTRNDGRPLPSQPWDGAVGDGVRHVSGDVSAPGLGLSPSVAEALASSVDLIVHSAAVTGFDLAAEVYQAVNVDGARHIAETALAASRPPGVVQVSTAYVCGDRSGPVPEAPATPKVAFTNPYEASKARAEAVFQDARAAGLRVAIARPSIVVGASDTGAISRFHHLYGLLKLVAEGRITALPAAPGATLDLAPINHVVGGLVDIVELFDAAEGRIFHLASGRPTPVRDFVDLGEDFPELHPPRFVDPTAFGDLALRPSERRLFDRAAALYAGYLQRDPHFATDNLAALSSRICPPLGRAYLRRLISHAVESGFIRRPGQRTSG